MATPDRVRLALEPARQQFFRAVWSEHSPQLGLTSSSQVSTSDVEITETLLQWLKESGQALPQSITLEQSSAEKPIDFTLQRIANIHLIPQMQSASVTHAFAHIDYYRRIQAGPLLQSIFSALVPGKGLALITCTKRNPIQEIILQVLQTSARIPSSGMREIASDGSLRDLAEAAGFETSKVRLSEQSVVIKGEELRKVKGDVQGILDGAFGQQGDGQSWESIFENAWNQELGLGGGGLKVTCWVLLAAK